MKDIRRIKQGTTFTRVASRMQPNVKKAGMAKNKKPKSGKSK